MTSHPVIITQLAADLPGNPTALYIYGPLGIVCGFFMLLTVALVKSMREESVESRKEIKTLSHRIDGLTRQLMMEMVERGAVGAKTMDYIRAAIAKIDARADK